ncbi:hypothetical protein H6F90_02725 [Trichocoleus sp. FACHB-591]|uniref:hypothetical protein n=1 Tax=Trichocoleus sp. FACHB-591 TaxID=2692872 RepID=UPI0016820C1D|nr:hypothetical protein [Trichocoleus sp. FACHB-591]MBD2094068.1 hypothetical protein [Trichocoleus sp. FACHB-591]
MKVKAVLAALGLAVLGWIGVGSWINYSQAQSLQRETLSKVKLLVSQPETPSKPSDLNSLRAYYKQLQETVSNLEKISNTPGLSHQKSQAALIEVRPLLTNTEQQLKLEEQALANLETAKRINLEAGDLAENPINPLEDWQQSRDKFQEASNILKSIPKNTFATAEAESMLSTVRLSHTNINRQLSAEDKADRRIKSAVDIASKAAYLTDNAPYTLQELNQAKAQWQLAINLLSTIPSEATFATASEDMLVYYRNNHKAVGDAIDRIKKCTPSSSYEGFCDSDFLIDIAMPPAYTTAGSDSDEFVDSDSDEFASSDDDAIAESSGDSETYIGGTTYIGGSSSYSSGTTHVRGYTRKDGTHVRSHTRSTGSRVSGFGSSRSGGASS